LASSGVRSSLGTEGLEPQLPGVGDASGPGEASFFSTDRSTERLVGLA
jgi:hypothetical protein